MKKIGIIIGILIITIFCQNVFAANYELRELIPAKTETTIVTNNFSYRSFYYSGDGYINFKSIKNLTNHELPISISIGLFDKDKKNIGTIFYCKEEKLNGKEEKSFYIPVTSDYLEKEKNVKDIHYISILDDNKTCKTEGSDYYYGQTVEQIGQAKNTTFSDPIRLFFKIVIGLGLVLVGLFLYKFLFTSAYENVDGNDVRTGYKNYNEELQAEREKKLKLHPPKPKPIKRIKTKKVLKQEKEAKEEDKTGTDLHNLYK